MCGWEAENVEVRSGRAKLHLERKDFFDYSETGGNNGTWYPFTSGELRSRDFYGPGCFSTCMKPSSASGTSSSFYAHAGYYDTPSDAGRAHNAHNEIDVEFVGEDTKRLQTNWFNRPHGSTSNSSSGHEVWHDLDFDAAAAFHAYGFKWTPAGITWYVDGTPIRHVDSDHERLPQPSYSRLRIAGNLWPVNKALESWAGKVDAGLNYASSEYRWIEFERGNGCSVRPAC